MTIPVGTTRLHPLDHVRDAERGVREPLTDRAISRIAPGTARIVSVVRPDPGTDAVVVEVASRQAQGAPALELARAPCRLTDVPVVDG